MKKIVSILMAITMMLSMVTFASAATFEDINGHTNQEAIEVLSDLDIVYGYGNGSFRPDGYITRGEVCAIITRTLVGDENCVVSYPDRFEDVSSLSKLRKYVDTAYNLGIMMGYSDNWFGLNDNVTYNQMAAIITRALGYNSKNLSGVWPQNVNSIAMENDLFDNVYGYGAQYATRGDVAQMIFNAFDAYVVKSVGYGVFMPTGKTFIEEIGFTFGGSMMLEDSRATFGDEMMTYTKNNKTVITDYALTDKVSAILYDVNLVDGEIIVNYGKTREAVEFDSDVEFYLNGNQLDVNDLYFDEEVTLIYKNNKLIRVVQWHATKTAIIGPSQLSISEFYNNFVEVVGDNYVPNYSVVTCYGDFVAEVSNNRVHGRISEISSIWHSDDVRVTLMDGKQYVIPEDFIPILENLNEKAYIEIYFDYAGNIFTIYNI